MKLTVGLACLAFFAPIMLGAGGLHAEGAVMRRSAPIVGGFDSPEDLSVVQVTSPGREPGVRTGCGGTVVAPNLVLTARHCIADFDNIDFECDPSLPDGGGPSIHAAAPPEEIEIYVSSVFVDEGENEAVQPSATGKKLFASQNLGICGNDVALVLLDRDLEVTPVPIRLGPTVPGEQVYAVGWGRTNTQGHTPVRLQRRDGLQVLAIGPTRYEMVPGYSPMSAVEGEVLLGQVGCNGDSGSPLRSHETGAIVGVLSYLLNVYPENKEGDVRNPVPWCGDGAATYYHALGNRDFVLQAFAEAGHQPWLEGRPRPAALGEACAVSEDCDSSVCLPGAGAPYCSASCAVNACPQGYACINVNGQPVCGRDDPNAANDGGDGGAPG